MKAVILICGGIVLIGLFIFLFLVFKAKRKHKAIKHYEELRDKLSVREAEEETGITEEEYNSYSGFSITNLLGGFIIIFVGATLIPVISKEINVAQTNVNITGVSDTLLNIVPFFFVVAVIITAVGFVLSSIRRSGLI